MKLNIFYIFIILFAFSCEKADNGLTSGEGSNTGTGGSLAKFTINNNYLYTVQTNILNIYDITDVSAPVLKNKIDLKNVAVETIFCTGTYLFFGTQNGMLIYSLNNPALPLYLSTYTHIVSCDPVVVSGNYAWVTLSTGTRCGGGVNQLELINISNIIHPQLEKIYLCAKPKGLAVAGNYLYLCDEVSGFTVMDISDPHNAFNAFQIPDLKAFDVIAKGNRLTITGNDGVYQYDCTVPTDLKFISKISAQ